MSNFNPPEKKARHGLVMRLLVIFWSAILSFLFVFILTIGSSIYHLRDVFSGREKKNAPKKDNDVPNYAVRQPYPDMKNLKVCMSLRYYAQQLGLDLEEFTITTKDGYVLTLHHLIDPNESISLRHAKKPILLQHGLLSCSGAWLTPGQNSLPFYFWEQGYDVWMGNNRCGFEPKHTFYEGNLMHNEEFWDWDIRAFAGYDLPCIIDNVLAHKPQHEKLVLVAHLQGCTQSFLMLRNSDMKAYHRKIDYFFALAPAVFPGSMFHDRAFIKFIHHRNPKSYTAIFGSCCFLRVLGFARKYIGTTRFFSMLSYQMFKYLFGWNINNCYHDKKVLHIQFLFNVTYVSSRLMSWWLLYSVEEGFSNQLQPKSAYKDGSNFAFTPVNTNSIEEKAAEPVPTGTDLVTEGATQVQDAEQTQDSAQVQESEKIPASPETPVDLTIPLEVDDSKTFFPYKDEWFSFNAAEELVPMMVFTGGEDFLVDGQRLATHMRHYERRLYKEGENLDIVHLSDFNHLDVIWSLNTIGRIGMLIHEKLQTA